MTAGHAPVHPWELRPEVTAEHVVALPASASAGVCRLSPGAGIAALAEEAADCLSETYRIAWEKRRRMPADDEARPWLFGVARNVSRQERASQERAAATSRELALAAEEAKQPGIAEDSAVTGALSELSPVDREILTMLAWDGLAPREVASVLGLSPNAVRIRAQRARARLRMVLAAGDGAEDADDHNECSRTVRRGA